MRDFQLAMTVLSTMLLSPVITTTETTRIDDSRLLSENEGSNSTSLTSALLRNNSRNESVSIDENRRYLRRLKSTSLPEFPAPIGNVTAVLGRDVRLICTVEHLGQYQVAWLKEETTTILSIDTNIIITNYRIFLIPDEEERKWVLHIKDVQESDRGFYQCQVNTRPMRSTRGYLEVVVPPTIIESQTSQVVEVIEHSNVSLYCKASGHPKPTITWRRDDESAIRLTGKFESTEIGRASSSGFLNVDQPTFSTTSLGVASFLANNIQMNEIKSDKLSLFDVDRTMGGIYVCTASNGIPSHVSKKIILHVKFPPKSLVQSKYVSVSPGEKLEIDCLVEAFPKATSYWSKNPLPFSQRLDQTSWLDPTSYQALSYRRKQQENEDDVIVNPSIEVADIDVRDESSVYGNLNKHRVNSFGYPTNHPHNRLQLREVDGQYPSEELDSPTSNFQTLVSPSDGPSKSKGSRGYVTVKQTPLNSYTYKIKMSIAKMQQDDYGQYTCVSSNSLGNSEAQVIVTRADKASENNRSQLASNSSTEENDDDHQSDAALDTRPYIQQQSRHSSSTSGNRVVYDENYLQAIKTRQNNYVVGTIKLQQKLKLRQSGERNGSLKDQPNHLLTVSALLAFLHIKLIIKMSKMSKSIVEM